MTNELEPLKECPFCPDGGDPRGMTYINESTGEVRDYVKCLKCECETAMYRTKQEATTAWNDRYKRTCKMPMYHGEDADDDLPAYYRNFKCDACGEIHSRYKHDDYQFCPHCGSEVVDGD